MIRLSPLVVVVAVLGGLALAPRGWAQAPRRPEEPTARTSSPTAEPDPLQGLPRPPDEPVSLYREAPAGPSYTCDPLPGPYFERDARLDPPQFPQPGWFGDVEAGLVVAHFKNRLSDMIQLGNRMPDAIHVPGAELDWTGSPRFEVGYRLPSGFGEFALSYRFLDTDGTGTGLVPDGLAFLKSRLDFHVVDVDYISREFSPYPQWGMRWRFGLRYFSLYYDSQAAEPFAEAAAGSGVLGARNTDHFQGFGPRVGVQLERYLGCSGWALVGRIDGASVVGRTSQVFAEEVIPGATGGPLAGAFRRGNTQTLPTLNFQVGLGWEPPAYPHTHLFLGYEYEYWWDAARLSVSTSRGEMVNQGLLLRAEFNF
jgi:hypothetical protein